MIVSTLPRAARRPRQTILSILMITLLCWPHLAFAGLQCVSSYSFPPSGLPTNQPFTLGFTDNGFINGRIKAVLMCSSNSESVLTLGQNYNENDYSPNSPTTIISVPQAKRALASCPSNVRHFFFLEGWVGYMAHKTSRLPQLIPS